MVANMDAVACRSTCQCTGSTDADAFLWGEDMHLDSTCAKKAFRIACMQTSTRSSTLLINVAKPVLQALDSGGDGSTCGWMTLRWCCCSSSMMTAAVATASSPLPTPSLLACSTFHAMWCSWQSTADSYCYGAHLMQNAATKQCVHAGQSSGATHSAHLFQTSEPMHQTIEAV